MKKLMCALMAVVLLLIHSSAGGAARPAKAEPYDSDIRAFVESLGLTEQQKRWAGLDDASIAEDEETARRMMERMKSVTREDDISYMIEEAERLRPFFFTELMPETSSWYGLYNIDRLWGHDNAHIEFVDMPWCWYDMYDVETNIIGPWCTGIVGFWGFYAGYGNFEGDLDVHDFEKLRVMKMYPNYINSIDASNCPELWKVTLSYYDGWAAMHFWNDSYYHGYDLWHAGDPLAYTWHPEYHTKYLDFSNCPSLKDVRIFMDGLEQLNIEGSTSELEYLYLAYNQIEGELPDLSDANGLIGFAAPSNKLTGKLTFKSPVLNEISTFDSAYFCPYENGVLTILPVEDWRPVIMNTIDEIDVKESMYGAIHLKGDGGYVNMEMFPENNPNWMETVIGARTDRENAVFCGWFNADGTLYSPDEFCLLPHNVDHDLTAKYRLMGDANEDFNVNEADVLLIMRSCMRLAELPDNVELWCDMNGDGIIDMVDALILLRMILGLMP